MTEENKAKCRQIADHYGMEHQLESHMEMLVEQCAELIREEERTECALKTLTDRVKRSRYDI